MHIGSCLHTGTDINTKTIIDTCKKRSVTYLNHVTNCRNSWSADYNWFYPTTKTKQLLVASWNVLPHMQLFKMHFYLWGKATHQSYSSLYLSTLFSSYITESFPGLRNVNVSKAKNSCELPYMVTTLQIKYQSKWTSCFSCMSLCVHSSPLTAIFHENQQYS